MARRSPEQILAVLEEQAREDEAFEAPMRALAAMSDAQLDDHLRGLGLDPAELEKEALALFVDSGDHEANGVPAVVRAVPQTNGKPLAGGGRSRRSLAVATWLAAGAAAATTGGALVYSLAHRDHQEPAPPEPSPSPGPGPSSIPEPVAMTPADERKAAAAALDQGDPAECLRLLDLAKLADPAGERTPDVRALRDRARKAMQEKPPKP